MSVQTISAVFAHQDRVLGVIGELKDRRITDIDVMMPVPDHDILEALPMKKTTVNWKFSLIGGIFGVNLGLLFPAWAHAFIFQQITGGKPVVSWPPFVIPGFEMFVFFTGVFTFVGVILMCRLPNRTVDPEFDPRATEDHYVVIVEAPEDQAVEVAQLLKTAGGEVRA